MYFLLKMGIFHSYVSLPKGIYRIKWWHTPKNTKKFHNSPEDLMFPTWSIGGGGEWCMSYMIWIDWLVFHVLLVIYEIRNLSESTPPKTNECPLKGDCYNRRCTSSNQWFSGDIRSFSGGVYVTASTNLLPSWWFQPIWRKCSSNWIISAGRGWTLKQK